MFCIFFTLMLVFMPLCNCDCTDCKAIPSRWSCHHCQCRCNGSCNGTGYCNGSCIKPYDGPTCHKYNVALNKSATQSDFYYPRLGYPSTNAVDGDTNGNWSSNSCIHTINNSLSNGWWRVDLNAVVSIKSVRIYDRIEFHPRNNQSLANFSIIVSNTTNDLLSGTTCYKRTDPIPENLADRIYDQKCTATGRYLTVSIPGKILHFCEIEVYACLNGTFGDECEHQCGHCSYFSVCNPIGGNCPFGCDAGWSGNNCDKVCMNRTFGDKCQQQCGHCYNDSTCDPVDGKCPAGCDVGWKGTNCKTACKTGRDVINCSEACTDCENGPCDHVTGTCIDCAAGMKAGMCATTVTARTDERTSSKTSSDFDQAAVAGSVGASLIAVLLIILVVCFVKRRKNRNEKLESTNRNEMNSNTANAMFINNVYVNDVQVRDADVSDDNREREVFHLEKEGAEYANVKKDQYTISVDQLKDYVEDRLNMDAFEKEFEEIPCGPQFPCSEGEKIINKEKNRFKTKYPYDYCRVVLPIEHEQSDTGYINASYVDSLTKKRCYIATQGPKKNTIWDFWTMAWNQNTGKIVMLTDLKEGNRVKCEKYWPDIDEPLMSGSYKISCIEEQEHSVYVIRLIQLFNIKTKETRLVHHCHFTKWPDHGVPDCFQLLAFHQHIRHIRTAHNGPMIVHCSAGIGRTGTFIGLDALLESGMKTGEVNVRRYVEQMRNNRLEMVQTDTQYTFLHQVLGEAFAVQNSSVQKDDFIKTRLDGSFDHAVLEYKKLMDMKKGYRQEEYKNAFLKENENKHRSQLFVPADAHRPCLSSYISGKNDYINAVLLPNCCKNIGFIATQQPLNHTVCDFWRLILDHACSTIICLQSPTENETYWPSNGEAMSFDSRLTVSQVEESEDENGFTIHKFNICYQSSIGESTDVTMYELSTSFWLDDDDVPCDISPLLQLEDVVYGKQRGDNHGVITLQCLDGATRCGLVCAIFNVMQRMRMDGDVNIYHAVRQLQIRHPQFVNSQKQYRYLYEAVKEYIISSSTYAN